MNRHHPLESELVAAMLLHILKHSNNPALVQEATSRKPNPDRLAKLFSEHNDRTHSDLMNSKATTNAEPQSNSRFSRVSDLIEKLG
jgi:hypothetical protein